MSMFGEGAPDRLARIFHLGKNKQDNKPVERLKNIFLDILQDANTVIVRTLQLATHMKLCPRHRDDEAWNERHETFKVNPAQHDTGLHYFTHIHVERRDLPWQRQDEYEPFKLRIPEPRFAFESWLEAVGFDPGSACSEGELTRRRKPPMAKDFLSSPFQKHWDCEGDELSWDVLAEDY